MIEFIVLGLTLCSWYLYRFITVPGYFYHGNTKYMFFVYIFAIICNTSHYIIAKRFRAAALFYCEVQSILTFVSALEAFTIEYPTLNTSIYPAVICLVTSYSLLSYNQMTCHCTVLGLSFYQMLRHYFKYIHQYKGESQMLEYLRFSLSLLLCMIFICCFSRAFNSRQRMKFMQDKRQMLMINLFNTLLNGHHDGLIVS